MVAESSTVSYPLTKHDFLTWGCSERKQLFLLVQSQVVPLWMSGIARCKRINIPLDFTLYSYTINFRL